MPGFEPHISDITHVIQLAIAPVFMLTAIGTFINALINRLARAVDRRRVVEDAIGKLEGEARADALVELHLLAQRIPLTIRAIALAVLSALLVCLLIGAAFVGAFISIDLTRALALLFIGSVVVLIGCLVLFMREVFLAAASVHHNVRTGRGA